MARVLPGGIQGPMDEESMNPFKILSVMAGWALTWWMILPLNALGWKDNPVDRWRHKTFGSGSDPA